MQARNFRNSDGFSDINSSLAGINPHRSIAWRQALIVRSTWCGTWKNKIKNQHGHNFKLYYLIISYLLGNLENNAMITMFLINSFLL